MRYILEVCRDGPKRMLGRQGVRVQKQAQDEQGPKICMCIDAVYAIQVCDGRTDGHGDIISRLAYRLLFRGLESLQ